MRFFNTAGPINMEDHYYIHPLQRFSLEDVLLLIEQKKYALLHAPRQTGKTSCLLALMDYINKVGKYKCVYVNIEPAQTARENVEAGMRSILMELGMSSNLYLQDDFILQEMQNAITLFSADSALGTVLSKWAQVSEKPLILFLDEVDALVGDTLISLLRQLRSGYNKRPQAFPQSVLLCGVRDIHDYRIHSTKEKTIITGGSAFNVKAESLRLGNFNKEEIQILYEQHTSETGQIFASDIYDYVWELTEGQPWLVNALAYEVCFKMKEGRARTVIITKAMIEEGKENIIKRRETHIDQLAHKLKEERVRRVIEPMLAGVSNIQDFRHDDVEYVVDLGLLKRVGRSGIAIANKIYQEVIPRELVWDAEQGIVETPSWYILPNGSLDLSKLLTNFQQFFRENADSWIGKCDYREAGAQLLMQAFLQRIINGGGQIEREYALGRKRTDLFIKWQYQDSADNNALKLQKEVIELKVVHAKSSIESTITEGLIQTAEYMDIVGVSYGHLVIFDRREGKTWEEKIFKMTQEYEGKKIEIWGM